MADLINYFIENQIPVFLLNGVIGNKCTCDNENCTRPGKHPYSKINWKILASNKKETIISAFEKTKEKQLNLAVATGRKGKDGKYLVVIDIDDSNSSFYEKIIKAKVKTFYYKTGGGGAYSLSSSFHEVIIYNRELNITEVKNVEQYLKMQYGL